VSRRPGSLALILQLLAVAAFAQQAPGTAREDSTNDQPASLVFSEVVVVVGSKTEAPQHDTTQRVNVILGDQLAAQAPSLRNITQLIQYQPGAKGHAGVVPGRPGA
jgi:outer membrane receptor protein involved in Fe transport